MKYIIIVNGKPTSGKTEFSLICQAILKRYNVETHIESSIDRVKEIYCLLGWDMIKTDQSRADLSILKDIYIRNCNGPIRDILRTAADAPDNSVFFYDCREVSEISKLCKCDGNNGINVRTVWIDRHNDHTYNNPSDDIDKDGFGYDVIIDNNGSIQDLVKHADKFCEYIIKGNK